jgi:hypothetical protein
MAKYVIILKDPAAEEVVRQLESSAIKDKFILAFYTKRFDKLNKPNFAQFSLLEIPTSDHEAFIEAHVKQLAPPLVVRIYTYPKENPV